MREAATNDAPPESDASSPLVTFVVLAYGQEDVVREAIEGAFAQTYQPLEIILSDDCSPDRTFAIMGEMAATYDGPHCVRLRQSELNFGTAMHVDAIAKMAEGDLLVLAAGDDISKPHRVERLVEAWVTHGKGTAMIHSAMEIVESVGERRRDPPKFVACRSSDSPMSAWAPTCAYSIDLFRKFPPMLGGSLIEDGVLFMRTAFAGRRVCVEEALVVQRITPSSSGRVETMNDPFKWNRMQRSKIICMLNVLQDMGCGNAINAKEKKDLEKSLLRDVRLNAGLFVKESNPLTFIRWVQISLRLMIYKNVFRNFKSVIVVVLSSCPYYSVRSLFHKIKRT